jgi:hypothetical protein
MVTVSHPKLVEPAKAIAPNAWPDISKMLLAPPLESEVRHISVIVTVTRDLLLVIYAPNLHVS